MRFQNHYDIDATQKDGKVSYAMDDNPSKITEFRKEPEESMIGFKLCSDGRLSFVNKATRAADAVALLAFARSVADQEIAKITAASLTHARAA